MLFSGSFGSPLLATSVELIQAETGLSCLKTDVIMTANRCCDLTFLNQVYTGHRPSHVWFLKIDPVYRQYVCVCLCVCVCVCPRSY